MIADSEFARVFTGLGIDPAVFCEGFRAPDPFVVAMRLASTGRRVIYSDRNKIPPYRWTDRATSNPLTLANWFKTQPAPCWSMLTGREGGVVVADIDTPEGVGHLEQLETENSPLPRTWRVHSGGGGVKVHIWFAPPAGTDDLRNQQSATILTDGRRVRFDVRGWHGHIVLPGSLHKSGRRYAWVDGCSPDECELAECPAWLWALLPKKENERRATPRPLSNAPRVKRESREYDSSSNVIGDGPGEDGFNAPIFWWVRQYFQHVGLDADWTNYKKALQAKIRAANASNHSPDQIERYASDAYLDAEFVSARIRELRPLSY